MLRGTVTALGNRGSNYTGPVNYTRAFARRKKLEQRRIDSMETFIPPIEPTAHQATALYRQLLKKAEAQLVVTDKAFFRKKVREEFEVTARRTSARVRGMMFEKGQWMVKNDLGGVV